MSYIYLCHKCCTPHTSKECPATSEEWITGTLSVAEYVGGWRMGNITFRQTRKPRWLTRVLCRWLLEWEWVDA